MSNAAHAHCLFKSSQEWDFHSPPLKSPFRLHLQQLFSEACVITITDDQMFGDLMMRPAGKT